MTLFHNLCKISSVAIFAHISASNVHFENFNEDNAVEACNGDMLPKTLNTVINSPVWWAQLSCVFVRYCSGCWTHVLGTFF